MPAEDSEKTMDSLLKEIDNEMSFIVEDDAEKDGWKIPLQDIGDETMEMIISHNTKNNMDLRSCQQMPQATIEETTKGGEKMQSLPPARKSVVFSEGVSFHELPLSLDRSNGDESLDEKSTVEKPQWTLSKFSATSPANCSGAEHLLSEEADSEVEDDDGHTDLSAEDLQKHSITDIDQKLSHMLDSKVNIHKLKQMAEEVDMRAKEIDDENISRMKFSLAPTKPLLPDASTNLEEVSLINFEAEDDDDDGEDEIAVDHDDDYRNEIIHSPSKIPLTNAVHINNFCLDKTQRETQTRVSSGSSWGESVTDLATIKHDRYDLLEYSSDIPKQLREKPMEEKEPYIGPLPCDYRNISQVFSVATTADGYKSAREIPSCPASVSSYNESQPIFKSDVGSVEDLGISNGLPRDEETLQDIRKTIPEKVNQSNESLESTEKLGSSALLVEGPELPDLPGSLLEQSETGSQASKNYKKSEHHENSFSLHSGDNAGLEFAGLHDLPNEPVSSEDTVESLAKINDPECTKMSDEEQGSFPAETHFVRRNALSSDEKEAASDNKQSFIVSDEITEAKEPVETQNKNAEGSFGMPVQPDKTSAPLLPPFQRLGSIFIDDPFGDECETSADSLDLTKSVKPSNYLSIWHLQEDEIKSSSPATSANSQFSQYTATTGTSEEFSAGAASIACHDEQKANVRTFRFKPRVISRSKFYYPENKAGSYIEEDEYVIKSFENALDPLRRNTVISRRIQENIRNRRTMHPKTMPPTCIEESSHVGEEELPSLEAEQIACVERACSEEESLSEHSQLEGQNKDATLTSTSEELDLLPCVADEEVGKDFTDFAAFLNALDHDNNSVFSSHNGEKGSLNIWDHDHHGWDMESVKVKKASFAAINRLLADENQQDDRLGDAAASKPLGNAAVLRTPTKEVSIGRGLSLKGYEADIAAENSMCDDFAGNKKQRPSEDVQTPTKNNHVGSPFKILKAKNATVRESDQGLSKKEKEISAEEIIEGSKEINNSSEEYRSDAPSQLPSIQPTCGDQILVSSPHFQDWGTLYIRLKAIKNLALQGIKHHNAKFSIEFDNGENVVQTPWTAASNENTIAIDREFEIILDRNVENFKTLIITVKCRYDRPQSELSEVVEKIPVGKKFPFGKNKYEFKRKFVQRGVKYDEWDYLFAQDGSFGRCEIVLDDEYLKNVRFYDKSMPLDLVNEWARKPDRNNPRKPIFELPRKAPSVAGTLEIGVCYLERTSPLENFPKTLHIARSVVEKYRAQQLITKEGFLLQEGGDVRGRIQRRYFVLRGARLLGYHDISRKAKVDINLLKVIKVFGPGDVPQEGERNLTDLVLFGGCIYLIFDDEEEIIFNTDSKEETDSWYRALHAVVELNKCHQPWVKQFDQLSSLNSL